MGFFDVKTASNLLSKETVWKCHSQRIWKFRMWVPYSSREHIESWNSLHNSFIARSIYVKEMSLRLYILVGDFCAPSKRVHVTSLTYATFGCSTHTKKAFIPKMLGRSPSFLAAITTIFSCAGNDNRKMSEATYEALKSFYTWNMQQYHAKWGACKSQNQLETLMEAFLAECCYVWAGHFVQAWTVNRFPMSCHTEINLHIAS